MGLASRTRTRASAAAMTLLVPAALFVGAGASAEPSAGTSSGAQAQAAQDGAASAPAQAPGRADAGDHYDPENVTAISEYVETLVKGNARFADKDFPRAIDLYKKAVRLDPRDALAEYLLGEAFLAQDNLGEAEAAFKEASELAGEGRGPHPRSALGATPLGLRAKILFSLADVYERQKKWDDARAAWKSYGEVARRVPDAGAFPDSGAAREKALDARHALDEQYQPVRERIAAEKAAAAAAAAKSGKSGKSGAKPGAKPPAKK